MSTLNWVGKVMCSALLQSVPPVPSERLTVPEEPPEPCDFGVNVENLDMCTWLIPPKADERSRWRLGMGELAAWIGGPRADHTTSDKTGNYTKFIEILKFINLSSCSKTENLHIIEPHKTGAGFSNPLGHLGHCSYFFKYCISFHY